MLCFQYYDTKFSKFQQTNFREFLALFRAGRARQSRSIAGPKIRILKIGGTVWTKSAKSGMAETLPPQPRLRRGKRKRAKIPFPPTPFLFAR